MPPQLTKSHQHSLPYDPANTGRPRPRETTPIQNISISLSVSPLCLTIYAATSTGTTSHQPYQLHHKRPTPTVAQHRHLNRLPHHPHIVQLPLHTPARPPPLVTSQPKALTQLQLHGTRHHHAQQTPHPTN